ncbi:MULTISPECIES: hybrid sensor histidine kinase/response regulator [unclassified Thermosynechococcus]|uniref:hybrid sensor histidine kinase/response regulator n=1 Tax=unclassified Thermosynechococcus TaxID=2622553 RepID=UPI001A071B17|nr:MULTISPECIES: hybrid sensor histidine kinase/response regulator [unclassified Thermosynechococcus]HIK35499.1 hybrid sensor histidine kinase/response regulator [Thermosynechococcus sp. M98_K2018_005]HIK47676.1 hybrid sensor histidine kinase/response regulator [Thermosynechococcus sp. M55_K2018_012]
MYIEDDELRSLYQIASTEHLQAIESGLLALEANPRDLSPLEGLLREAHSLKGDSRMLGVTDAESLVHHLEEIFSRWRQGSLAPNAQLFEVLYRGLDAVKKIAHEAVTGEPANVSPFHIAAELMQFLHGASTTETLEASSSPIAAIDDLDALMAATETLQETPPTPSTSTDEEPGGIPAPVTTDDRYSIDSVRVDSRRLDALMTAIGDLSVTQQRIARQQELIAEVFSYWEQVQAHTLASQRLLQAHPELLTLRQHYDHLRQHLDALGKSLQQLQSRVDVDNVHLTAVVNRLEKDIQDLQFLPLATIFNLLPRAVRDIAKQQNKQVRLIIEGAEVAVDRRILEGMKAPLTHLVRNALDHGIESPTERQQQGKPPEGTLTVRGRTQGNEVVIEVIDDGRGLDQTAIRETALKRGLYTAAELATMSPTEIEALIFAPGFSTRQQVSTLSGRGVGLDVVRANVEELNGSIQVTSTPGQGCCFQITLRANRATMPILTVRLQDDFYGLPIEAVATTLLLRQEQLSLEASEPILLWEQHPVPISWLADLLGQESLQRHSPYPCVILHQGDRYRGLIVDEIVDFQNVQLKPQHPLLQQLPYLLGVTLLHTGDLCHLLQPTALMTAVDRPRTSVTLKPAPKPRILLVEDSLPIRTQLRRILERAGYEVVTAVDGADGFQQLRTGKFQAVVSDVEMPQQNGIEMTQRIRQLPEYQTLPIILVTTLAGASDRQRALAAGANAYLTKGNFDQSLLLDTLKELIYEQNQSRSN